MNRLFPHSYVQGNIREWILLPYSIFVCHALACYVRHLSCAEWYQWIQHKSLTACGKHFSAGMTVTYVPHSGMSAEYLREPPCATFYHWIERKILSLLHELCGCWLHSRRVCQIVSLGAACPVHGAKVVPLSVRQQFVCVCSVVAAAAETFCSDVCVCVGPGFSSWCKLFSVVHFASGSSVSVLVTFIVLSLSFLRSIACLYLLRSCVSCL
jgi:hypothetical protein